MSEPLPKKLLILNERDLKNPLAGGAEVHLFEVFGRLAQRGYDIKLLAASFSGCERIEMVEGIEVHRLANRYLYYGIVPFVARRMAKQQHFDLVIDVLHKLPFLSPWFVPIPCLAIVHHLFGTTAFRQVPFPVALATWLSEKLIPPSYRRAPVVAVSPSTREDLVVRGMQREHISVIPNGLDEHTYTTGTEPKSDVPLVAWLGRVEKYKRIDVFLRALAKVRRQLPEVHAVVLGSGSALEGARRLAADLGLRDCVNFLGYVTQPTKVEWLRRSHILVNTSEKEGWGLTVIEGDACGTPTIGSNVPGLCDSIRDGETGLLVRYGDVDDLAAAMARVLTDPDLCARLRTNALEWASRFRWDTTAAQMSAIMDEVAAGGAVASFTAPVFTEALESPAPSAIADETVQRG